MFTMKSDKKNYKILVVSDSHGTDRFIERAIKKVSPIDALIHCGDTGHDICETIKHDDFDIYSVTGNCDIFMSEKSEISINVAGHKIVVVHGHRHNVKYDVSQLHALARKRGADIVLFGHSHVPEIDTSVPGILLLNPGSISQPRQFSRNKSFAVLSISEGHAPKAEIFEMEEW